MILAALLACGPAGHADPNDPINPALTPPEIVEVAVQCDPEAQEWTISASATSWTGGGTWFVSVDGDYVEQHRVPTAEAEPDGSGETLSTDVGIVGDWREAGDGASVLHCNESVGWRFTIDDTDGLLADCFDGGVAIAWPADIPSCE